jgi:hypothetical protein
MTELSSNEVVNMRKLLAVAMLIVVVGTASDVMAAQRRAPRVSPDQAGQIPSTMLAQMGLRGMERLPDRQGEQIRGSALNIRFPSAPRGFANVFVPGLPFPIFFPIRAIGILNR